MISVCIPVYNYDVSKLLTTLIHQIELINKGIELIVIDDGSEEKFNNKTYLKGHTYIELPENIGRSRIRNLFKKYTQNQYLLFMDCDSMITNNHFLENYINNLEQNTVIYGGRIYPKKLQHKQQKLSWIYGSKTESKPVSERIRQPHLSFMTNNFLIDISIFKKVYFNENLSGYGHEDTLFGYELYQSKIKIIHIDNSILNIDIESNEVFIKKTEEALRSLKEIHTELGYDSDFCNYVTLLKFHSKTTPFQKHFINFFFNFFEKTIRYLLIKGFYSGRLLNFYKIGYYIKSN